MSTTMMKNRQWFDENAIDTEFIRAHEDLTPKGRIHTPISSAEVLEKFREKARSLGLELCNEKGALKRDGGRYMYLADVKDTVHPDYALSVGFRQSSDQSMSFQGLCASHCYLCGNGCCSGVIKPSKMRHTIGNVDSGLIDHKIDTVFSRFATDAERVHQQIASMKATRLTDELLGRFVRSANGTWKGDKFVKNPLLGSSNLMAILAELDKPTLNDTDDSSMYRLLNAATYVTTHKMSQRNPSQALMASRFCNNLIMSLIEPNFTPLGDAVEVDVEDVD